MVGKKLTIRDAKNEIQHLENELDLYLTKKKINFYKTQPGAVRYKDIITNSVSNTFDKFSHYVIKDEKIDKTIYAIQESINAYQKYIIDEMKRISENKGSELIVYLRDEERLSWNEISRYTHYSLRQCHRLYNDAKK